MTPTGARGIYFYGGVGPWGACMAPSKIFVLGFSILTLLSSTSGAQEVSVDDARRAADTARSEAEAAQAELERARAMLEEAEQRAEAAAVADGDAREALAEAEASSPTGRALEAAEEAERRARRAEDAAREAQREVHLLDERVRELERRLAYDRTGFYVGVAVAYAPEDFHSDLEADGSRGVSARAGYRVHSHVALEGRFDLLEAFDVEGSLAYGEVEPWAATGGVRVFVLPGRIQPYVGLGMGLVSARIRGHPNDPLEPNFSQRETEFAFRVAGGLDFYLTPHVLLNLDAAYLGADGELSDFSFATLGGGVEFRF